MHRSYGAFRFSDLWLALGLLSRLPLPAGAFSADTSRPAAHAAWAYPLVGLVLALIASAVGWATGALGLPAAAQAALMLLSLIMTSGAMHEDGLADCADGFCGGWQAARRLEIMKDSQIGSYGVIALTLGLGLRWWALGLMVQAGVAMTALIAVAMISRAGMVGVMYAQPHARQGGLSAQTGHPGGAALALALGLGVLAALVAPLAPAPVLLLVAGALGLGLAKLAQAKIGGQTGDVLGAVQQITEIGLWLALVAALPTS